MGQRQAPVWQVEPIAQTVPQAPQLLLSDCVLTQVGVAAVGVQSTCPVGHIGRAVRQVPVWQVWAIEQALPHMPQLAESVWRFAHTVPQAVWPVGHIDVPVQAPAVQVCPVAQVRPHMPQLAVLVWVSTHMPPHEVSPVGQADMRQAPAVQVWPAVQAVPQPPQLLVSVMVSTQVPPQAV